MTAVEPATTDSRLAVALLAAPDSVPAARHQVTRFLRLHGCALDIAEDAELVIGELAANAVQHAPAEGFSISVDLRQQQIRLECSDSLWRTLPHLGRPREDTSFGRGLLLVDGLSDAWGVEVDHAHGRKTVWALLGADTPR